MVSILVKDHRGRSAPYEDLAFFPTTYTLFTQYLNNNFPCISCTTLHQQIQGSSKILLMHGAHPYPFRSRSFFTSRELQLLHYEQMKL